ncbi:hypothetical protein DICPUDRAFT_52190 [Dictyostelium purpureum]|uniref:Maltose/galactoside acetyltransferase domain-containing protein n=1 Tax=Dictyostelium purpureum TaxID=5786 RepID=F0Z7D0_DICPU|nr:uncharacterized protein DICPUDRAFT_52190 [Dictyostelium purpureum]EGC40156.1 hypothetical protein DICPUDRAFT_52190 [Dictyostelium purpureum]|eukprot:XP_003283346.1 hypothetical protein DICPUDRAFT_52190 [Dictyostelium purpureum]
MEANNSFTEKEKMIAGQFYLASDAELVRERLEARQVIHKFNNSLDVEERKQLVKKLFGTTGENIYLEPTLRLDYGYNIHVGENFYANFGAVFLDVCPIRIGKNCMLASNVQLLTAAHPLDPYERCDKGIEFGKPITLGDNCWLGGGVIIIPGVTLGNNVVVGAGAVVTKSFGDNVVLAGNPAKVIKTITPKEQENK